MAAAGGDEDVAGDKEGATETARWGTALQCDAAARGAQRTAREGARERGMHRWQPHGPRPRSPAQPLLRGALPAQAHGTRAHRLRALSPLLTARAFSVLVHATV